MTTLDGVASPRPILVVGSPRSGTTLIGHYIASAPNVLDLHEFHGNYLALDVARGMHRTAAPPALERYVDAMFELGLEFSRTLAREQGCSFYCNSSPLNLLLAEELSRRLDDALFVLLVRRPAGVLQSLERSHDGGKQWAGATWEARARLYARFYANARWLPPERTIVVSYDELVARPQQEIDGLDTALREHMPTLGRPDHRVLCRSHATADTSGRPTIARLCDDGEIVWTPIPGFDEKAWTPELMRSIAPLVAPGWNAIAAIRHAVAHAQMPAARESSVHRRPVVSAAQ